MIPTVKQWLVRSEGKRWIVLAPTKHLAILNFRHAGHYGSIVTGPSRVRKERRPPAGLIMAFEDQFQEKT